MYRKFYLLGHNTVKSTESQLDFQRTTKCFIPEATTIWSVAQTIQQRGKRGQEEIRIRVILFNPAVISSDHAAAALLNCCYISSFHILFCLLCTVFFNGHFNLKYHTCLPCLSFINHS
jgi:hypothetical protein